MKIIKIISTNFFQLTLFTLISFLTIIILIDIFGNYRNKNDNLNYQKNIEPIYVGNNKQLFIDSKFIEKKNNLIFKVNKPQKIDHQVIKSELDWEAFRIIYFSIIQDNNLHKMWYQAYDKDQWNGGTPRMGYAYSHDGFNWIKPNLGIVEYNGSKNNNIILEGHKLSYVFLDKNAKTKSEKFKMIYGFPDTRLATSSDGINWNIASIENSWKIKLKINHFQNNEDHRGYGINFSDRNKLYRFTFSKNGVHYLNNNNQYKFFGTNFHTNNNKWNTFVFEFQSEKDLCGDDKYKNKIKLTINDEFHHTISKSKFPYNFNEPKISFGSNNTKSKGQIDYNIVSLQIVEDENLKNCNSDRWKTVASHFGNNNPEDEGWVLDEIGKETLKVYPNKDNSNQFWSVKDTGDKSEGEYYISPIIRKDEIVYNKDWDTQKLAYWDDNKKKYKIYLRSQITDNGYLQYPFVKPIISFPEVVNPKIYRPTRALGIIEQDDILKKWDLKNFKTILSADEKDPKNSDIYFIGGLYKYPYAEDVFFAFPSVYQHFEKYFIGDKEFANDGVLDIQIAASRNGINWIRYDRQSFISRGLPGEKDYGLTFPTGYFFRDGNYLYQYYKGWPWTHQSYNTLTEIEKNSKENLGKGYVGLVRHRMDGFVSLNANLNEGSFVTPLMKFNGDKLFLNIDVSAMGYLKVSILDKNNKELENFALKNSDKIVANDTQYLVSWQGNTDLSTIKDKNIKLKFEMKSAKIYSFQFK